MHTPGPAQHDRKTVAVSVGVLRRGDGRVLVSERAAGKTLAGYLEFPGGKIEAGENPADALARELGEELGVGVDAARQIPLIRFEYAYPAFTVQLHVYRLDCWDGEPDGREGQRLNWMTPEALYEARMLPANRAVLNALTLPGTWLVTPSPEPGKEADFLRCLEQALRSKEPGGTILRLRDSSILNSLAPLLVETARECGRPLVLNSGQVRTLPPGFSGLHVPASVLSALESRPQVGGWVGASVHTVDEAARARRLGLDYVIAGSVNDTPSHPGILPLGWARFGEIAAAAGMPTYAIGGVGPEDMARVREQWGQGIAAIRAFWPETA